MNYGELVQSQQSAQIEKDLLTIKDVKPNQKQLFALVVSPDREKWEPSIRDWRPELIQAPLVPGANGVGEIRNPNGSKSLDVVGFLRTWQRLGARVFFNGDRILAEAEIFKDGKFLGSHAIFQTSRKAYTFIWEYWHREGRKVVWGENTDVRLACVEKMIEKLIIRPVDHSLKEAAISSQIQSIKTFETRMSKVFNPTEAMREQNYQAKIILLQMKARLAGEDPFIYPEAKDYTADLGDPTKKKWAKKV